MLTERDGRDGGDGDKAARVYQGWLEARYFDFLRVLLGWVAEVDDFHRQVGVCRGAATAGESRGVLVTFTRMGQVTILIICCRS